MKKIIAIAGCFVLSAAQAEVYKCTDAHGKVTYQSQECATGASTQVDIKSVDPNKIAEAQAKLAESLKQEAERQKAAAAAAQKARDIASREALSTAVQDQSIAIERSVEIQQNLEQNPEWTIAPYNPLPQLPQLPPPSEP